MDYQRAKESIEGMESERQKRVTAYIPAKMFDLIQALKDKKELGNTSKTINFILEEYFNSLIK